MLPLGLLALLAALMTAAPAAASPYFADWSALTRDREPLCVDIPANLSLCHDIGYTKMRLPNLLDHDTLHEVSDQARSWVPLVNIRCHADTQLFLCSLFAPVCLERPIYPCRSLCNKVRLGCEGTMRTNGYPWPQMLQCDKFPVDNDMCITSQSERSREQSGNKEQSVAAVEKKDGENVAAAADNVCSAQPCNQPSTYDNIIENYCQADFVLKMKFRRISQDTLVGRKVNTVFKAWRGTPAELRKLRKPRLKLRSEDECCAAWIKEQPKSGQRYLIMGKKLPDSEGGKLIATFILPWSRDKDMKRARRSFKQVDCQSSPRRSSSGGNRKRGRKGGNRRRRHRHGEQLQPKKEQKVWQF